MSKRSRTDVLQAKEARLRVLQDKSDFAIITVRSTIEELEKVNADIEAQQSEIDAYLARLQETRSGLGATHAKNAQIVQNFKSLICEC